MIYNIIKSVGRMKGDNNMNRPLLIQGNVTGAKSKNWIENIQKTYDNENKRILSVITFRNDRK
jgi:hypothetical protein